MNGFEVVSAPQEKEGVDKNHKHTGKVGDWKVEK